METRIEWTPYRTNPHEYQDIEHIDAQGHPVKWRWYEGNYWLTIGAKSENVGSVWNLSYYLNMHEVQPKQ